MAAFSELRRPYDLGQEPSAIGKNSEVFTIMDPVTVDSNGFLAFATAGTKVIGHMNETITMASDNQTVAKVKPKYTPAEGVVILAEADQAWTQTDIGAYADIVGSTGSVNVNFAAGASGQYYVLEGDPLGTGSTTQVAVTVAEPQKLAFAQA